MWDYTQAWEPEQDSRLAKGTARRGWTGASCMPILYTVLSLRANGQEERASRDTAAKIKTALVVSGSQFTATGHGVYHGHSDR